MPAAGARVHVDVTLGAVSPSRRALLTGVLGGGAAILSGCGGRSAGHPAAASSTGTARSTQGALPQARAAERALLRAYAATVRRHPALQPLLAVPIAHHRVHAAALDISAPTTGPESNVPADPRAALRALIDLESSTSRQRADEAVTDRDHGSLLAALAAAEAVHVDLLAAALPTVGSPPTQPAQSHAPVQSSPAPVAPAPTRSTAASTPRTATAPVEPAPPSRTRSASSRPPTTSAPPAPTRSSPKSTVATSSVTPPSPNAASPRAAPDSVHSGR